MKADRIDEEHFEVHVIPGLLCVEVKVSLIETTNEVLRRNGWETDCYQQVDEILEVFAMDGYIREPFQLLDVHLTPVKDAIDKYLIDDV